MTIALFFIFVVLCIILGMKTKVNMGFYAVAAALILGVGFAEMKAAAVIALFPLTLAYNFFIAGAFYGFSSMNGTIDVLAKKVMYKFRNQTWMGPVMLLLVTMIIGGCGTGATAILITAPFAFSVVANTGMKPIVAVVSIFWGYIAMALFPWTSTGGTNVGMMQSAIGDADGLAAGYLSGLSGFAMSIILFLITVIVLGGFKKGSGSATMEEPPAFNAVQKKNVAAIIISIAVLVIPALIQMVAPNPVTAWITKIFNMQFVWTVGVIILSLLDCGDPREILTKKVSWTTICLIGGMGMLFGLAKTIGVVDALSVLLTNFPSWLIIPMLAAVCGFLSFFISGAIIVPFFMPMVSTFAALTGASPIFIAAVICYGGLPSAISPISTGGANALAGMPDDEEMRSKLVPQMMILAVLYVVGSFLFTLGLQTFFI